MHISGKYQVFQAQTLFKPLLKIPPSSSHQFLSEAVPKNRQNFRGTQEPEHSTAHGNGSRHEHIHQKKVFNRGHRER